MDWNDPTVIEIEKAITFQYGKKFRERGPPPPSDSGVELWRGQAWRPNAGRWGNRGGKRLAEWNQHFYGSPGGDRSDLIPTYDSNRLVYLWCGSWCGSCGDCFLFEGKASKGAGKGDGKGDGKGAHASERKTFTTSHHNKHLKI